MRLPNEIMRPTDQIRAILKEKDWTQHRVASSIEVAQSTVARWLKGGTEPEGQNRDRIAVLYSTVFDGDERALVPLKGKVGAGQAVYPIDDEGDDMVEAPPNATDNTVAVRVIGESMLPVFYDGWLLYYSRQMPPSERINKICVAQLADGRLLVKTVRPGLTPGLWTLTSTNAEPIEDVAIEWVAPIDWIKPR